MDINTATLVGRLTADPELVGREIGNHLEAAEIRERNCIFGLPLKWALTAHVDVPAGDRVRKYPYPETVGKGTPHRSADF